MGVWKHTVELQVMFQRAGCTEKGSLLSLSQLRLTILIENTNLRQYLVTVVTVINYCLLHPILPLLIDRSAVGRYPDPLTWTPQKCGLQWLALHLTTGMQYFTSVISGQELLGQDCKRMYGLQWKGFGNINIFTFPSHLTRDQAMFSSQKKT